MSSTLNPGEAAATACAAVAPCPITESTYIHYGCLSLFWYRVREVGNPLFLSDGWLVPVRYGPGKKYALLHYQFGGNPSVRYDRILEVMPNSAAASCGLLYSSSMPRILSAGRDKIVLEVFEEVEATDEEFGLHGQETYNVASTATLYGVLGPRNGRHDTLELNKS